MKQLSPQTYAELIFQLMDDTRPMVDLEDDAIAIMRPILASAALVPILPSELRQRLYGIAKECIDYLFLSNPEPEDN